MKERKLGDVEYALEEGQVSENAPTEQHLLNKAYTRQNPSARRATKGCSWSENHTLLLFKKKQNVYIENWNVKLNFFFFVEKIHLDFFFLFLFRNSQQHFHTLANLLYIQKYQHEVLQVTTTRKELARSHLKMKRRNSPSGNIRQLDSKQRILVLEPEGVQPSLPTSSAVCSKTELHGMTIHRISPETDIQDDPLFIWTLVCRHLFIVPVVIVGWEV